MVVLKNDILYNFINNIEFDQTLQPISTLSIRRQMEVEEDFHCIKTEQP